MDEVVDLTASPAPTPTPTSNRGGSSIGGSGIGGGIGPRKRRFRDVGRPNANWHSDLTKQGQVLRIAASAVALVTGLHLYADRLVDTFVDHVYQVHP